MDLNGPTDELASALARLASVERRAAEAEAEAERADAVVAMLWLRTDPDLLSVYRRAVRIFGKPAIDRIVRQEIEVGNIRISPMGNA